MLSATVPLVLIPAILSACRPRKARLTLVPALAPALARVDASSPPPWNGPCGPAPARGPSLVNMDMATPGPALANMAVAAPAPALANMATATPAPANMAMATPAPMQASARARAHASLLLGLFLLALAAASGVASARTLVVRPGATGNRAIQTAMDLAHHGDTVLVEPGDYPEHVQLRSGVTLRSREGAGATRLVGDGHSSILLVQNADSLTRIEGLTFTGGGMSRMNFHRSEYAGGGAVLARQAALRIRDCSFKANILETGRGRGGALALFNCPAVIERNEFSDNYADAGGAIYALDCSLLVVRNNRVGHNKAERFGGGIFCDMRTKGTVEGNVVDRNWAGWGGGVHLGRLTRIELRSNTVVGNTATQWGGGIFLSDCQPLLVRNLVAQNASGYKGGGIAGGRAAFPDMRCNLGWQNTPDDYHFIEDSTDVPGSDALKSADPGFCNFLGGNFHPTPGGPADSSPCGVIGALEADCPKIEKLAR